MTVNFRHQQEAGCCDSRPCCGSSNTDDWGRKSNKVLNATTDADIAKEMNQLSFQEREKVYDDIHGVTPVMEETPEFLASRLQALDEAISKTPKLKRRLFDRAIFLRPSLATDKSFKLMFLRADEYDVRKAASRMVKFFNVKAKIFGDDKLAKDITLEDLGPRDVEIAVLSGCCLVLPQPDQTGRPIITYDISKFDHSKLTEMLRFCWYLSYCAVEEEAAQIRGVATLNYAPVKRLKPVPFQQQMDNVSKSGEMLESLPLRVTGYHFCTDDPKMQFVLNILRMSHGQNVRLRIRPHFGSELEMQYSLLTFGINCNSLLTVGEGKTELHDEYLQIRRDKEFALTAAKIAEEERTGVVLYPEPEDVLIGRGRPYHEYVGTRRLLELIENDLERYYQLNTDRLHKTVINHEIVRKIKEGGGRFLTRTKSGWKILDEVTSREKTANLFRYRYNLQAGKMSASTVTPPRMTASLQNLLGNKRLRDDLGGEMDTISSANKVTMTRY